MPTIVYQQLGDGYCVSLRLHVSSSMHAPQHTIKVFTDLVCELLAILMTWHCVDGSSVGVAILHILYLYIMIINYHNSSTQFMNNITLH